MHVRALLSLGAALLVFAFTADSAHAEEGHDPPSKIEYKRVFVGLSAGVAYAKVNHPLVQTDGFAAAALGMHVGFNVSERWTIGAELSAFEHGMVRESPVDPFRTTAFLSSQALCDKCDEIGSGGWTKQAAATFTTIGPRVEFSPFGRDQLYFGLSTGLGMILGVDTRLGIGGGARAGYRYRIGNVLGLSVEGGVQAQYFETGTTFFPYAAFLLRPYF